MPNELLNHEARSAVFNFASAILHGDEIHQELLLEAARCFVMGNPLPKARAGTPIVNDTKMLDWLLSEEGKDWFVNYYHADGIFDRKAIEIAMPLV